MKNLYIKDVAADQADATNNCVAGCPSSSFVKGKGCKGLIMCTSHTELLRS